VRLTEQGRLALLMFGSRAGPGAPTDVTTLTELTLK
jgi:hypothetical protein